jgi:hypothetical protein
MPLQLTIPPQGHRVESRRRLSGGLAAERQGVGQRALLSIRKLVLGERSDSWQLKKRVLKRISLRIFLAS